MKTDEDQKETAYPWKGFLVFLGLYILGLVFHYPVLRAQAQVFIEIIGESFAYTPNQFAALAMIQPILLGVIAIYGGHRFAHRVGLRSLINEKMEAPEPDLTTSERPRYSLKESVPFIVMFAIFIAALNLSFDVVFQNWLPETYQPNFVVPNITQALSNVFYSGLGQEILLRWGVMTSIVYVFSYRGQTTNQWAYIVGFVFTAMLYAFAQYSSVSAYTDLTPVLMLRLLLLNGLDGILYGWLYAKFHFEASILSHMLANSFIILGTILIVAIGG